MQHLKKGEKMKHEKYCQQVVVFTTSNNAIKFELGPLIAIYNNKN